MTCEECEHVLAENGDLQNERDELKEEIDRLKEVIENAQHELGKE